jgi:hypothetical protein
VTKSREFKVRGLAGHPAGLFLPLNHSRASAASRLFPDSAQGRQVAIFILIAMGYIGHEVAQAWHTGRLQYSQVRRSAAEHR